jgi:hypothetical protein
MSAGGATLSEIREVIRHAMKDTLSDARPRREDDAVREDRTLLADVLQSAIGDSDSPMGVPVVDDRRTS